MVRRLWMVVGSLVLVVTMLSRCEATVVKVVSDCESTAGWPSGTQLSSEAHEGARAVATALNAGATTFFSLNYASTGVDLSQVHAVAFWWRVEGSGLTDLKVKVTNHPLVDGWQAVYEIWRPADTGPYPTVWRRSAIVLSEVDAVWGSGPNLTARQMTFRTQTAAGAAVRLFVDHVVAVPRTFSLTLGMPHSEERAAPLKLDFDGSGAVDFTDFLLFAQHFGTGTGDLAFDARYDLDTDGRVALSDFLHFASGYGKRGAWLVPTTVRNETDDTLTYSVGSGEATLSSVTVPAGDSTTVDVEMPGVFIPYESLAPLEDIGFALWAEVEGEPDTRLAHGTAVRRPMALPDHPRLLFGAQGVGGLEARISKYSWAGIRWESVLGRANQVLDRAVVLPPRGGNWSHYYASPTTGATLRRGNQIGTWQWEHIDPVTGEVFLGDPTEPSRDYDGVVINSKHSGWANDVRDLGIVYQVTGDRRYATKAREILLAYANQYLKYPLHNTKGEARVGGGRVGCQTLNEAVWLIRVCQGADLIWETLSGTDSTTVAEKLMQPAAREVILPHKIGVHNIQCWKNSAVGLVGFLLDDQELIWEAIENPERGYRKQMQGGVMPDGMWWEGAWGYHFYTLSALWNLTEAARNCGLDLYGSALKSMYDVPLVLAMPNMHLPAFNDSGELDLRSRASYYEVAYARYGSPNYEPILASGTRANNNAMWFGTGDVKGSGTRTWISTNYPQSGYAVLARGLGENATWLCVDYAPHGGGHGHPDKLGFVLYSRREVLGYDPGSTRYGLPANTGWYKTSVAHNTLVVDEASQERSEGTCLAFGTLGGADYAVTDAGPIYDNVTFRRTAAMLDDDLIVFVDQVDAQLVHTLDIAYHHRGSWVTNLSSGTTWSPPQKPGYSYLRDARSRRSADGELLRVRTTPQWDPSTVFSAAGDVTETITATGVGSHEEDRVPMVIFRRFGRDTAFGWGVSISGQAVEMARLTVRDASGGDVTPGRAAAFSVASGTRWSHALVANPDGLDLQVSLPDGTVWPTNAVFDLREF